MAISTTVRRLPHAKDLSLPAYATPQSAGCDLLAAIEEDIVLKPFERRLIPTGLCLALPADHEAQVRPRSGLALKHGVTVLNSPGTIDADYRGEVGVILINFGNESFTVTRGMRVAQMIFAPVAQVNWQEVENLPETSTNIRGSGGFGSTGT